MITTPWKYACVIGLAWLPIVAAAQIVAPKPLNRVDPGYPVSLADTALGGTAEVDITVKADGSIANPELAVATQRAFGKAAMAAVKAWQFAPGTKDGVPVDMLVTVPFVFAPPDDQVVNFAAKRKVYVKLAAPPLSQSDYDQRLKLKGDFHPIWPRSMAKIHDEFTVAVKFVVAPDGTTLNPEIVGDARKELVLPALITVAQARYAPPVKNGQGVYVETTAKLDFDNEQMANYGDGGGGGGGRSKGGH